MNKKTDEIKNEEEIINEVQKAYMQEYRDKNREKIRAYNKKWRDENREKVAQHNRNYWLRQAEKRGIE